MLEIKGKYGTAKIYASILEDEALAQINDLINSPVAKNKGKSVAVMPDCHAGKGCTIGTTMYINDKVNPNLVGVDIGCGVMLIPLGNVDLDMEKVDYFFHNKMPSGLAVNSKVIEEFDLKRLYCYDKLVNVDRLAKSLMSLGGGNHFCELDIDMEGNKYLVIHTGSRNLGKQVADIYSEIANEKNKVSKEEIKVIVEDYKKAGREFEIEYAISEYKRKKEKEKIEKDKCWLEGKEKENYLHDMKICQEFAHRNRYLIASHFLAEVLCYDAEKINELMSYRIETIHNYIDFDAGTDAPILRKGAVSAYHGEVLVIPMNMKDGTLICFGKGNPDWNYSAPHGAGRLLSRVSARTSLSIDDFKNDMNGIYTTCVNDATIDESPRAYKSFETIMKDIKDTVDIISIVKPIYNFKAGN